jgi:hypothetical protein
MSLGGKGLMGNRSSTPGMKRSVRHITHSSRNTVKNEWSYTVSPPYLLKWCLFKQIDSFIFTFTASFYSPSNKFITHCELLIARLKGIQIEPSFGV